MSTLAKALLEGSETMSITSDFDIKAHHIRLFIFLHAPDGSKYKLRAILDTGATTTEVSDRFLDYADLLPLMKQNVHVKEGQETQKYGKITFPKAFICTHEIEDMTVYVSRFKEHWGVDALIGLDFFKKFRVTIDYQKGQLITEAYQ